MAKSRYVAWYVARNDKHWPSNTAQLSRARAAGTRTSRHEPDDPTSSGFTNRIRATAYVAVVKFSSGSTVLTPNDGFQDVMKLDETGALGLLYSLCLVYPVFNREYWYNVTSYKTASVGGEKRMGSCGDFVL